MRIATFLALLLVVATIAFADTYPDWDYHICTNETVEADRSLLVQVAQNATVNKDSGWDSVRVMLAKYTNYSDTVLGPVCTLIDCIPIDAPAFSVVIPANAGPSGTFYSLSWELYSSKDIDIPIQYNHNMSTLGYSRGWNYGFTLSNANGSFHPFEGNPRPTDYHHPWLTRLSRTPCEAYACVRVCIDQYYADSSETRTDYMYIQDCVQECANVEARRNNCPNAGGFTHVPELDTSFVPDSCARWHPKAFPAAAASASAASAAVASASSAAEASSKVSSSASSSTAGTSGTTMLKAEAILLAILLAAAAAVLTLPHSLV